jgi:hypothetical protein
MPPSKEIVMATSNKTQPIKPGAKLDPKGSAMIKKIKELSKKAQGDLSAEHVGHIRVMPKNQPPGNHCSCSCSCS